MSGVKHLLILAFLLSYFNGIHSNLTIDELKEITNVFRQNCEETSGATEEMVDGINMGKFPKDRALACYTHCILVSFNMIRKGKLKADLAIRNVKTFMPSNLHEQWLRGIEACKNYGDEIKDECERSYATVECFYNNNDYFMFP